MTHYLNKLSFIKNKTKETTTMLDFQFTAIATISGNMTQQIVTGKKVKVICEPTVDAGEKGYLKLNVSGIEVDQAVPYELKRGKYRMTQHDIIQALKSADLKDISLLTLTAVGCDLLTKKGSYISTDDQPTEID